ncbi:YIP1 family protein [Thalassovita taeanensis]|uniref:Yip1 domain-containing protein n=1 Tax=Thalassovita taeanensis TaxID=657014 RepID=A0A1H8Z0M7_9RHOB|nr:YIP1 family protein [Thalassovita taeanensis]SEP57995.1 Yip1 domain-containing protein [Thalassovita taeanensis]
MTLPDAQALTAQTLRDPRGAARTLLALRLNTSVLWPALALIAVLNAVLHGFTLLTLPSPQMLPGVLGSPLLFALFLAGGMVISTFLLTWIGQALGGKAQLDEILVLVVWVQMLRLALQAVVVLLYFVLPGLADLAAIVAGIFGLWIMINFMDEAQGFGSIGKSILVLVLATLGVGFGLSVFLLLLGATAMGLS